MSGHGAYWLLGVPFLAAVAAVGIAAAVVAARRLRRSGRNAGRSRRAAVVTGIVVTVALLVMTVVFDNVIVTLRVVAYDPSLISGATIGAIPVEDLLYTVAAVVLLPSLWVLFARPSTASRAVPPSTPPTREGEPTR